MSIPCSVPAHPCEPCIARSAGRGTSPSAVPITVAVSGPDNVGKTTQLRILARRLGVAAMTAGPLVAHDRRWPGIQERGMAAWWFGGAPIQEVVDVLTCSYLQRAARVSAAREPVRLVDRGVPMLEAVVAATVAVREDLPDEAAAGRARELLAPFAADLAVAEAAEYAVVLLHDPDPTAGTARSLARETAITPIYACYQRHLHRQMRRLVADGRFAGTVVTGDRPIMAVQDEFRRLIAPMCDDVPKGALHGVRVVALGGLSESGKSTAGEYLRVRHGHARLKIGYLVEDAAARAGIHDPYAEPPIVQAELLIDALDRYCAAHHYLDRVTLESLHGYEATVELARLLGDRLTIVYLNTSTRVRAARGVAGPGDVHARDEVKARRGADTIARIADIVIDNDGSRLHLERNLDALAVSSRWLQRVPAVVPVTELGLPATLESYVTRLVVASTSGAEDAGTPGIDLMAVSGSGARRAFQPAWSDLDLFVLAPAEALPLLRAALHDLRDGTGEVKVGVTIQSLAECRTGALTPRILHVLTGIGSGQIPVLWARPGVRLPAPRLADDVAASVHAGVQAAFDLRRMLLRTAPDVRVLYKLAGLLAKVMLRFEGVEEPCDRAALTRLLHPDAALLIEQARTDVAAAEGLAEVVLDLWLATFPTGKVSQGGRTDRGCGEVQR